MARTWKFGLATRKKGMLEYPWAWIRSDRIGGEREVEGERRENRFRKSNDRARTPNAKFNSPTMHRTPANDILCSIYRLRRVESFIMTLDRRVFRVVSRLGNRPFHAKSNSLGEKGLIFKFKFRPISKSSLRIAYLIPCTNLSFFGSFFVLSLSIFVSPMTTNKMPHASPWPIDRSKFNRKAALLTYEWKMCATFSKNLLENNLYLDGSSATHRPSVERKKMALDIWSLLTPNIIHCPGT